MRSISDDTSWMQVSKARDKYLRPRRLLLAVDLIGACVAFVIAYVDLRIRGVVGSQLQITVFNCVLILVLAIVLLFRSREYSVTKRLSSLSSIAVLVRDAIVATALTSLLSYSTKGFFTGQTTPSRSAIAIALGVFAVLGTISRFSFGALQNRQYAAGRGARKILVAGDGTAASDLLRFIVCHPEMGIKAVGTIQLDVPEWPTQGQQSIVCAAGHHPAGHPDQPAAPLPVARISDDLKGLRELDRVVRELGACEVVIALDPEDQAVLPRLATFLSLAHVPFKVIPSLFEETFLASELLGQIDVHVVDFRVSPLDRIGRFAKRAMDISIAVLAMLVLSPLLMAIAIAIVADSGRPIIFAQQRVGKNGHRFVLYKFRTMIKDAESRLQELATQNEADSSDGRIFKMRSDPRITRVGAILRRLSLDELPQFVNVLKSEMSVVGPRPPLPGEVAKYEREHLCRLRVLPGITGLWQVSGRSDLSFEDMVRLDRYYVDNWSVALDLRILFKTIGVLMKRDGAY
jgi:lipopolysaccharide/colanic/teichoic acid biosynthesis glycosyltransferase